ncbi:titin homolog isoform X2 [Venturia canescens]|uniref:titin homolog isoform X2 n=1 Tax=Venturia canescens TaxID=32260 RepID=UPI001C9D12EA|nr:titin homolog isoform X2 [Venturia canescens]
MSADSPRRGLHKGAQVISPQPISDRSIIDSVAGIINDIVPQAYAGVPNSDNKETITWARFEYADVNNSAFYPDYIEGSATPPLLLVLGYTTGVQVWVVAASGEATEVLSWRQGIVRTLRILPDPKVDEDHADPFQQKRPMVAICDSSGPGPQFCNISFISLKTGEQAKSIKFKNPVCDVLANRRSVVVTFSEKIAVFDARTLEDVVTVTTCYLSPGPNPNPVALGTRWLAYSEKKLLPARRSSGGSEGEGVQSYTAAVLYAAKSLGKGLRGLGETVASSLTGNSLTPMAMNNIGSDVTQPGVVTILDLQASKEEKELDDSSIETVVAHFTAHNDAIVAMTFDLTGALLMTADKRGHDFHVFRIQPHPGGPTLAAVHHLYVLHRGDTTAKVQDMTFSSDTRWAAVSTVRGTTHVFPVAPYGGPVGVRTHSTPHVVNRLSRFHRSAGLTDDSTRSHSPVSHAELPVSVYPYSNPRLPPYPHPTILHPLAQIRQPSTLNHANNQSQPRPQQRQRLHLDDGGTLQLKICACFAPPRAWIYAQRDSTNKAAKRAVDSLFIMACHGNMIQYDLEPKPAAGVPKEKVCDDTTIELEVEAKGQWPLLRGPNSLEIVPPLTSSSPLLSTLGSPKSSRQLDTADDRWLSQVEIVTHAGPHRRLWMGPQFVFKTYNAPSGVNLIESEAIEIGVTGGSRPARSNPVNMPHATTRPLVPVVIDGSGSSYEQSPRFMEAYGDSLDNDAMGIGNGENQLREDLAEAMLETSAAPHRVAGRRLVVERVGQPVTKVVNPLGTVITVMADEEDVSSSQEFDEPTPEPPRSLCAEEGPASLGDFDTEGQELRNLTEICAEMRSASEPAIDSVPDESIKEVRENKTLCAEAVVPTMSQCERSIDYEREESFRDVPTSLSLCAEQGEIPNSPMTLARETNWNKRSVKREDSELQERTYAKAKYVVNYDDDSVVLMENKSGAISTDLKKKTTSESIDDSVKESSSSSPEVLSRNKCEAEPERASKRPNKVASSARANKRSSCLVQRVQPKYLLHESEDSVVIEDTRLPEKKVSPTRILTKEASSCPPTESPTKRTVTDETSESVDSDARQKRGKDRRNSKNSRQTDSSLDALGETEAMIVEPRQVEDQIEISDTFVDLKDVESTGNDVVIVDSVRNDPEPMEATVATGLASLPLEPPPSTPPPPPPPPPVLDDISCMDYHIVETTCSLPLKETAYSHQSDDDIEHIHSSEVTQMLEIVDHKLLRSEDIESSPMRQRKSSKSTISDDDIEHINSAELVEILDRGSALLAAKSDDFHRINSGKTSKSVLSFDEDIEHVYHSEVCDIEPASRASPSLDSPGMRASTKKKPQDNSSDGSTAGSLRARGSRKRKDVVVIDSDNSEAEVTVIVKTLDSWSKSKTPEKDLAEEIDRCVETKEHTSDRATSQSLPKKTRVRTAKLASATSSTTATATSQKRQPSSDMVEIIDIDAMQKAEMEVASVVDVVVPPVECKISESRLETNSSTRSQKSRRNKKAHLDTASSIALSNTSSADPPAETPSNPRDVGQDSEETTASQRSPVSWSSIVRKPQTEADEASVVGEESSDTLMKSALETEAPKEEETAGAARIGEQDPTKIVDAEPSPAACDPEEKSTKKRGKKSRVTSDSTVTAKNNVAVETPAISTIPPVDEATSSSPCETRPPVEPPTIVSAAVVQPEEEKQIDSTEAAVVNDVKMNEDSNVTAPWKFEEESQQPDISTSTVTKDSTKKTPMRAWRKKKRR